MQLHQRSHQTLHSFTKLVLIVSALVQLFFGIVGFFFTDVWNSIFWSAPLPAWPEPVADFAFLNYLATGISALFALYQGTWDGAKVYFAFSFPYIVFSMLLSVVIGATTGVPPILWAYVTLSVLYLPAIVSAWMLQRTPSSRSLYEINGHRNTA